MALIYLMAIAFRYSYEFVPDRAHIGLSPDYMIAFLCLLQLAALHVGSAFIPTLMASLAGFAALAVASLPFTEVERLGTRRFLPLSSGSGGGSCGRFRRSWPLWVIGYI